MKFIVTIVEGAVIMRLRMNDVATVAMRATEVMVGKPLWLLLSNVSHLPYSFPRTSCSPR
mgnify:CR=1 FL=1